MLIGGQAVLLHGEPRTQDIDITLGVDPTALPEVLKVCRIAALARDVEDAVGVVRRRGPEIDWPYMESWAREFASVPGHEDLPERIRQPRGEAGLEAE